MDALDRHCGDHLMGIYMKELPSTGFVRLPVILQYFPVCKSTWWAGVRTGRYPQPYKLGPKVTAWRAEDIRALLDR